MAKKKTEAKLQGLGKAWIENFIKNLDPDNTPTAFTFPVSERQRDKINAWCKEIDKKVYLEQKKNGTLHFDDGENPYYGMIGGGLTYCFTPTSMGVILIAQHSFTKEELNVSDFDSW